MIPPGAWLGLLGGGQLGRMFSMAAQSMGYRVMVVDPGSNSPAGAVADAHIQADYLDERALARLSAECTAVTTEFENVPAEALRRLAAHCFVSPAADAVAVAQDRIREKAFLAGVVGVGPHAVITQATDLGEPLDDRLLPGILKRSRMGYDGKGQARVATRAEALEAFQRFGSEPCVLEQRLALECELSVVVARSASGECIAYPTSENIHENGILDISIVPARASASVANAARDAALAVAEKLGYVGVLCVEFFVVGGQLIANEIAPRPHNSGHYSIDACVTSQFEQQARILAGMPLGDPAQHCPAVMVNLLGDLWGRGEPPWERLLRHARAKLHLYGKHEARPGRKMGHFTVLGASVGETLAEALAIRRSLRTYAEAA